MSAQYTSNKQLIPIMISNAEQYYGCFNDLHYYLFFSGFTIIINNSRFDLMDHNYINLLLSTKLITISTDL